MLVNYEALTWALKEIAPVGLHRQSGMHAPERWEPLNYYVILGQTCTLPLQQTRYTTQTPNPPNTVLHRSHTETVKLDKKRTDRTIITVNIN